MKEKLTKTQAADRSTKRELEALAHLPDDQIDFSDIPATSEQDWESAVRGKFYKPVKQQLTVRIDADVVDWLKKQGNGGRGYQSRLNQILRTAMVESARKSSTSVSKVGGQ